VATIHCLPRNREASAELVRLRRVKALDTRIVEVALEVGMDRFLSRGAVISVHLVWEHLAPETAKREQGELEEAIAKGRHVWLLTAPRLSLGAAFIKANTGPHVADLRHHNLGGLTKARVLAGWIGPEIVVGEIHPGRQRNPRRPLDKFLEPSVRLMHWRSIGSDDRCWRPSAEGAAPYPWPWPPKPLWVEAPSVYFGGKAVERPMSSKELCQLIDLQEDWGEPLVHAIWNWENQAAPPLRLLVEFRLAARPWLQALAGGEDNR
jgi:hypothetical protein